MESVEKDQLYLYTGMYFHHAPVVRLSDHTTNTNTQIRSYHSLLYTVRPVDVQSM
jgi:hypothetical protein